MKRVLGRVHTNGDDFEKQVFPVFAFHLHMTKK